MKIPPKLKAGDEVRVIAPAHSMPPFFSEEMERQAAEGFEKLGLKLSFGKHIHKSNDFKTTTVENRLEDLHDAFADPDVKCIIPVRGGSSSSQLLKYVDYDLIKNNPKVLCGLSDITEFINAIGKKADLVTYYGPHYVALGASSMSDYSFESMRQNFIADEEINMKPSGHYANSHKEHEIIVNDGFWTINEGEAQGRVFGGNMLTTNFMTGSEYIPSFENCILFLEENHVIDFRGVQNEIQSLLNQPEGESIKGIVFGRFQRTTEMTRDLLTKMVKSKKELEHVPVIGNVDFGHSMPVATFPVGGEARIRAGANDDVRLTITEH